MDHWQASCALNRALCGRRAMPVCARVYARPDGLGRTAFLRLMDRAFDEPDHCARVWRQWRAMQEPPPITGRTKPNPAGY